MDSKASRQIPIDLIGKPELEVDGTRVAHGLGLDTDTFRRLMDAGKVAVLCERGVGEDTGLYRATFYYGSKRVRLVLDRSGTPVS